MALLFDSEPTDDSGFTFEYYGDKAIIIGYWDMVGRFHRDVAELNLNRQEFDILVDFLSNCKKEINSEKQKASE